MDIRVEFESWVSGRMITAEKIVSALGVGGREGGREGRERGRGKEGWRGWINFYLLYMHVALVIYIM